MLIAGRTFPIQRMPNVSLMPGEKKLSLSDLIADTEDGIYIKGDGSWSIDMQRYNFQFTGQEFWEIKNGKIIGMLRDVAYQGNTVDLWNSCDAVCDSSEYKLGGSFFCGKGRARSGFTRQPRLISCKIQKCEDIEYIEGGRQINDT